MLILLLTVSLAPLILISAFHYVTTLQLGNRLASDTHKILTGTAQGFLLNLVDDYGRILNRDRELLEVMLNMQAREINRLLTQPPPASPDLIYARQYDAGLIPPGGMVHTPKHYRLDPSGNRIPTPVTYDRQFNFLVNGTDRDATFPELARLSVMTDFFRTIFRIKPQLILWQYVGLESGAHILYPGSGGYPDGYDPRERDWYRMARQAGGLVWGPPVVDALTQITVLTLSRPVHHPDGTFAGVTAIDVLVPEIFQELKMPAHWAAQAKITLVSPVYQADVGVRRLAVAAQMEYLNLGQDWRTPVELAYLDSGDPQKQALLTRDALLGRSGVLEMAFKGEKSFWAFGAAGPGDTFPVVIIPYDAIMAQAAETREFVLEKTRRELMVAGLILVCVVLAAAFLAVLVSGRVTGPITQLSEAATRLARGDYRTKVKIRTRDELQDLGETFNRMGKELEIRQRQLVQADKMASLGVLVAGMAHEINNPNSLILLNIRQLQRAWKDIAPILEAHFINGGDFEVGGLAYSEMREDIPDMLAETRDRARRIGRIVNDLKDFSRQNRKSRTRSVDLNAVAEMAVRLVDNSLKNATTRFSIRLADDLPRFRGSPLRIEQIVVNLLLNACQAVCQTECQNMDRQDREIALRTQFNKDMGELILEVADQGCGIAADDLPKLADPFFTTRRESGGTGLGLFVSTGIAAEHGGRLAFESSPGSGTRARLILHPEPEETP